MELLDGDLRQRTPVPWRGVRDAVRRVLFAGFDSLTTARASRHQSAKHPRTSDGRAKLIDFGAMVPMGPVRPSSGRRRSHRRWCTFGPRRSDRSLSFGATLYFASSDARRSGSKHGALRGVAKPPTAPSGSLPGSRRAGRSSLAPEPRAGDAPAHRVRGDAATAAMTGIERAESASVSRASVDAHAGRSRPRWEPSARNEGSIRGPVAVCSSKQRPAWGEHGCSIRPYSKRRPRAPRSPCTRHASTAPRWPASASNSCKRCRTRP
jgi:hypothetical protein